MCNIFVYSNTDDSMELYATIENNVSKKISLKRAQNLKKSTVESWHIIII